MKYDFYWDIDQLEALESTYAKKIDEMIDIYSAVCDKMNELPDAWQGKSSDSFSEKFDEWKKDFLSALVAAITYDECLLQMISTAYMLVEIRDGMADNINLL